MEEFKSKVYIQIDEKNRVLRCEGGYTMANIKNIDEWIFIDEGDGDKYNLCQAHYFEGGLFTEDSIPRYKYVDGEVVLRSEEEIESDKVEFTLELSQLDRIEAQVTYTAMMTDTLMEV